MGKRGVNENAYEAFLPLLRMLGLILLRATIVLAFVAIASNSPASMI